MDQQLNQHRNQLEALVDRFILFCVNRKVEPALSRSQLISRFSRYALLRSRVGQGSIKWRPSIMELPDWSETDELEWIAWLDVHCSLSDWEAEVLAPVYGSHMVTGDAPEWSWELHGFLCGWIQRIRILDEKEGV